jgi:hypothetical protein
MRRTLKVVGGALILVLFFCLAIWRNFFFYPKVWSARVTVDGQVCNDCAICIHCGRIGDGCVLVRHDHLTSKFYSLVFPRSEYGGAKRAIWKCVDGRFRSFPAWRSLRFISRVRPTCLVPLLKSCCT